MNKRKKMRGEHTDEHGPKLEGVIQVTNTYKPTPSKNGLIFVLCVKTKLKNTTKPCIFHNR